MRERVALVDDPLAEPADVGLALNLGDDGRAAGELRLAQDATGEDRADDGFVHEHVADGQLPAGVQLGDAPGGSGSCG